MFLSPPNPQTPPTPPPPTYTYLADVLTGVGHGDFRGLIGVQPHLALAALEHGGRQALLDAKVHHLALSPLEKPKKTTRVSLCMCVGWACVGGRDRGWCGGVG